MPIFGQYSKSGFFLFIPWDLSLLEKTINNGGGGNYGGVGQIE